MINFLFLTVPIGTTYQSLKHKLQFPQDNHGVSNWVMNFPLTIYSADLTEKHIFTSGSVQVLRCSAPNLQQRWKYFVMTRANGSRYYCTSHIFYEKSPILKKQPSTFVSRNNLAHSYNQFYLPKCLILMSEQPYFKVQTNLIKIYRELRRNNQQISHQVNCWLYDNYERLVLQGRKQQWNNIDIKPQGRSFTCPIQVAFNFYIEACNAHTLGSAIYWSKETKMQVLHLYNLPKSSLYQFNYFFHLPISGQTLIIALAAILQEKQIIFTSYNQNSNVMLMQTLLSMIMPLKWHFLYVPNLPEDMIEAAKECFMPMIVGIHKKNIHLITDKTQKIIIHVDTNSVEGKEYLHELPNQLYRFLKAIPLFTTNRRYLDWEKEVRIYSILMISQLLSDSFYLNQKETNQWIEKKRGTQRYFFEEFCSRSMMYQRLKQDTQDPLYQQESLLLRLNPKQRQQFLYNRFNKLLMEISYPNYYDNEKQWIKFYYNHNEKRKQLKDFKKSLIFDYSSSSTNQSQMSSKNSSLKKLQIGGRKIGFTHSTVRL